jgi:hypothetical protein
MYLMEEPNSLKQRVINVILRNMPVLFKKQINKELTIKDSEEESEKPRRKKAPRNTNNIYIYINQDSKVKKGHGKLEERCSRQTDRGRATILLTFMCHKNNKIKKNQDKTSDRELWTSAIGNLCHNGPVRSSLHNYMIRQYISKFRVTLGRRNRTLALR